MSIPVLLAALLKREVTLRLTNEELIVAGHRARLDAALVAELRQHRAFLHQMVARCGGEWSPPARITPELLPLIALSQGEIDNLVADVPGGAANVQDIYPLAPLQEGILFHHLLDPERDPYALASVYGFDSRDRLDAYLRALQSVIDRHDILRTAIVWEGVSQPVQVVWQHASLPVEEVQLDPAKGEGVTQLRTRLRSRNAHMNMRQAPLMRAYIAVDTTSDATACPSPRWLLLLLRHHLTIDHTTLEVLQTEIAAFLLGEAERLPAPVPFRNFVAVARSTRSNEDHEGYFRAMLGDVREPTAPFGLMLAQGQNAAIREADITLAPDIVRRLRARARTLGVTVASVCHLAWALVLARATGRNDVVFGTVLFGRMDGGAGAARGLGLFINTLPIRLPVGDVGVASSVRATHEHLAQLLEHEHASLALAQRCSGVPGPEPLFTSLLNYRHGSRTQGAAAKGGRAWAGFQSLYSEERTNYPLTISIDDANDRVRVSAQVIAPVDPGRVCRLMRTALERLVHALEGTPEISLGTVDVLPFEERKELLQYWNQTASAYPNASCVHTLFEAHAIRAPKAIAIVDGDCQVTYDELNRRAETVARRLRSLGVGVETRVVIAGERSLDLVIATLGVLKAGGVYVPLDVSHPIERLRYVIADCGARVILNVGERDRPFAVPGVMCLRLADLFASSAQGSGAEHSAPQVSQLAETAAYVMYTSGSTGRPKGVVVPHRAIPRLVLNNGYAEFRAEDRVAFTANPAFDAATLELWAPLLTGGCLVVIAQDVLLDPHRFAAVLRDEGITVLHLTTALFNQCAAVVPEAFASLRLLLTGGEHGDARAMSRVLAQQSTAALIYCYGPTETTTFATTWAVPRSAEGVTRLAIGKPIGNAQVYVLDAKRDLAPVGVAGELYVGGDGVTRGYQGQPGLTADRFEPDPFSGQLGARLYRTGDLARWMPDGTLEFLGRSDAQAKVRGYRVELGEVEAVLTTHPSVRHALVLTRNTSDADETTRPSSSLQLIAYYVGNVAESESLRTYLSEQLPAYMVPTAFVRLDALPLTPNGKVDRAALPIPTADAFATHTFEPPQGRVEQALARIWSTVLDVPRVGRHDDFFALGGHSLFVVSVIERMRQEGLHTDVRALFTLPTVAALATVVGEEQRVMKVPPNMIPTPVSKVPAPNAEFSL